MSFWFEKYGLTDNPFRDTLDSSLFFKTVQHEKTLVKLLIAIEDCHALLLLSGASGTGKTLAVQVAARELDTQCFEPVFVFVHPGMGKGPLLAAILAELGVASGRFLHERLAALQAEALRLHELGRRLLIIIDEAHFLKADALHLLRTLSNLETEEKKLVSVVLVAEANLRRRLNAPSYASLRGRITFFLTLKPLSLADMEQYVKFRLLKCGSSANMLEPEVYPLVHKLSGGIPREVNRVLYNAFIEAAASVSGSVLRALRES